MISIMIGFLESMGMHETLLCISFEEHLNT